MMKIKVKKLEETRVKVCFRKDCWEVLRRPATGRAEEGTREQEVAGLAVA